MNSSRTRLRQPSIADVVEIDGVCAISCASRGAGRWRVRSRLRRRSLGPAPPYRHHAHRAGSCAVHSDGDPGRDRWKTKPPSKLHVGLAREMPAAGARTGVPMGVLVVAKMGRSRFAVQHALMPQGAGYDAAVMGG